MKVREFIQKEIDIDVYDDVCEELGIAFCGPLELTDDGQKEFADVLNYEIDQLAGAPGGIPCAIVRVDDPNDSVWKKKLARAKKFFQAAAGYCPIEQYELWFKEEA